MKNKKNKLFFIVKMCVTSLLIALLISSIGFQKTLEVMRQVQWKYLVINALLWPVVLFVSSLRWNVILRFYGIDLKWRQTFSSCWIASFFSNFLPAGLGGDIYRFVDIKKNAASMHSNLAISLLVDRLGGLVGGAFISIVLGFKYYDALMSNRILLGVYLIQFLFFILPIIFWTLGERIVRKIPNSFSKFKELINALIHFNNFFILVKTFLLSIVQQSLGLLGAYLTFRAFDLFVPYSLFGFLMPMTNLADLIPFTINGIGLKEWMGTSLFTLSSYPLEKVGSALLMGRIWLIVLTISGGIYYLIKKIMPRRIS